MEAPTTSIGRRTVRPGVILALVCGAQFMVILDIAIVNVALPAMQVDLGVAQSSLQWVVVTYGVTLGGFLLLGGRAADLLGRRRVLVAGLTLFSAASLSAGIADSLSHLVVSRAAQAVGAAMAAPAALSILTSTSAEGAARTRALGIFGAVAGSAASVGVIASGLLTDGPGWEWVFLINVPIGIALIALIVAFVPPLPATQRGSADLLGALSVTSGLLAIVYAINKSTDNGWLSAPTLGFVGGGICLLGLFVLVERRTAAPLVPLSMFSRRMHTTADLSAALVFAAFFATIFQVTLFMQQVLGYSAVKTGVAWLGNTAFSLVAAGALAPKAVERFGPGRSLIVGQILSAAGLLHMAQADAGSSYWSGLFPGFVAVGLGLGLSFVAVQVAAFVGVEESVSGLAGGLVETAREVGGAIGVAAVATVAIAEGFQQGMLVAAGISLAAALGAGVLLRRAEQTIAPAQPQAERLVLSAATGRAR